MDINPDVPSSSQLPGTFLSISTAPSTTGTPEEKDLFPVSTAILSASAITGAPYNLTAGTAAPNDIQQYSDVSRVAQSFNRRSPVANRFRSALQEVPFGINIYLPAIAEPTGSGFAGFATKLVTVAGTAVGTGEVTIRAAGHPARFQVANGDNGSVVAADGKIALDSKIPDAPMVTADVIDHSLPVITIATNATGSNFTITANGVAKVIAITAAWTPTQSATAIAAALAGDATYPVTATSALGVVNLTWRTGFPVVSLTILGADATQTYALTYLTTGSASGATIPLTYVVRGEEGNDSPIVLTIPPELTGITFSPAVLEITTNAAGDGGSASLFTIRVGSLAVVVAIPVATTPTNAALLIKAAVNAATFPLTATCAAGFVTLFYRSGWVVNRIQVNSTEDGGGQIYTLADRHDSAGLITTAATTPGSATFTALAGSGTPTLTTMLANKAKLPAFIEWSVDYADTTSIDAISAHIELYANGYYQQNQRWTICNTSPVETIALISGLATPNLGNYWRSSLVTYQEPPVQGGAFSTQIAARLCATDLPYNMDGQILKATGVAPMLPARADTEMSPTTIDVALGSYHLTPLRSVNGNVTIVRGKTTWTGIESKWGDWSYGRIFDALRFGLRNFLNSRFFQKVLFIGGGTVRVPNGFTLADVRDACGEYLDSQDGILVDNSASLKPFIEVAIDPLDASRILIALRERAPRENHQRVGVLSSAQ